MSKIILICVSCNKIDSGDGVWSKLSGELATNTVNCLCPDCSHERYPQFYSDFEKPQETFRERMFAGKSGRKKK